MKMERTIPPENAPEKIIYAVQDEPIVISKALIDLLLKEDHPTELIALYTFYYYTSKWQKTDQPKATDNFCEQGLSMGRDRFTRAKQTLTRLGLIEQISSKDQYGKINGWFIRVNFIWTKDSVKKAINDQTVENSSLVEKNQTVDFPLSGKTEINALSSNNINALSSNNKKINKKEKTFIPPLLEEVVEYFSTKGYTKQAAEKAYDYYSIANWIDSKGNPVRNWKQKMIGNWFKNEYRINGHKLPVTTSGSHNSGHIGKFRQPTQIIN
jgi:hypothetical protein